MYGSKQDNEIQAEQFISSEKRAIELEKICSDQSKSKFISLYAPLPLQRPVSIPKVFPFHALGKVAGDAAARIHEVVQSPDATCGQSVLAVMALACQGLVDVEIDGRRIPTSLFLLTVSESGERKSATDKLALKPFNDWQKTLISIHRKQLQDFKNRHEIWKLKRAKVLKEAADNPDSFLEQLEAEPKLPSEGIILCEEPTIEGLEQLLERGQPSAGIFSDEGGRMIGGHAMSSDNMLKTACGLSNLWDGKPLTRVRKGEGSKVIYGRRLSVHLMTQPIVLDQLLNNEMLVGQGLLSRCLIAAPISTSGNRKYVEVNLSQDPKILKFYDLINTLLNQPYRKASSDHENDYFAPEDALDPFVVGVDDSAKKIWIDFHNNTDKKMAEGESYYSVKQFASKASEQVLRIAAIFAFSERTNLEIIPDISAIQLRRAIELVEFYLSESVRIFSRSSINSDLLLARQALEWILKNRNGQPFPLSDVYQYGPSKIRDSTKAKYIMKILQSHELVIEVKDTVIEGKKVRSAWLAVKHDC